MTLHVIEVKVVNLTVLQFAKSFDIIELDSALGNRMTAAQVHDKLAVDEQIYVIVTGKGKVQVIVLVVNELGMPLQGHIVVGLFVILGALFRIPGERPIDTPVDPIAAITDGVKAQFRNRNTIPTLAIYLVIDKAGVGDIPAVIVVVRIVVCRVKAVVGAAIVGSTLHQSQTVVIVDSLTITLAVRKSVVQQEIGCVIVGRTILSIR